MAATKEYTSPFVDARDHGVVADGSTDDTAEIQAAITAASTAGGGTVVLPEGTARVSSALTLPSSVVLQGQGRGVTVLKKTAADFNMIDMVGSTGDDNHISYAGLRDLSLHGNNRTGYLVRCFYGNNLHFENVRFEFNADSAIVTTELWDSKFVNCIFDWTSTRTGSSGATAGAAVILQNSSAASGVGLSTESTNQIHFIGCRFESNEDGDIVIRTGTGGSGNPYGFFFLDCKFECAQIRYANRINIGNTTRSCHFINVYVALSGYSSSSNGTPAALSVTPDASFSFENAYCYVGAGITASEFFFVYANTGATKGPIVLRNLWCNNAGTLTNAFVNIAGGTEGLVLQGINATAGTVLTGTPTSWAANSPLLLKAGAVADGDFPYTPPNGTMGLDTTNHRLYVRDGGSWRYAALT